MYIVHSHTKEREKRECVRDRAVHINSHTPQKTTATVKRKKNGDDDDDDDDDSDGLRLGRKSNRQT